MVRFRSKLLNSVSRTAGPSRPQSLLPKCPSARHIGRAILVSGLVGATPLRPVSPLTAILESAPDDNVDLNQAKSALRVLAALGDGIAGVPWLKGAAGLGLEIVNTLDNVQSNKSDCRDLARRICQFLIIMHRKPHTGHNDNSDIMAFQNDLHRILRTVKTISAYRFYHRLLKADDIKQQILKCNQMLSHSRDVFLVGVHVNLVAAPIKEIVPAETHPNYRDSLYINYTRPVFFLILPGNCGEPSLMESRTVKLPKPRTNISRQVMPSDPCTLDMYGPRTLA